MKRTLTWIGMVLGFLLLGGGFVQVGLRDTLLIARDPGGFWSEAELLHGLDWLLALWPLVLAGAVMSAIPAWLFIVGEFLQRAAKDREDREERNDQENWNVGPMEPDPLLEKALQTAQERARDAERQVERVTQSLQEKDAQIAAQAVEAEQCVLQAQREAARMVKTAQAQAARAERRAQNTAYAYERLKRKFNMLRGEALATPTAPAQDYRG